MVATGAWRRQWGASYCPRGGVRWCSTTWDYLLSSLEPNGLEEEEDKHDEGEVDDEEVGMEYNTSELMSRDYIQQAI